MEGLKQYFAQEVAEIDTVIDGFADGMNQQLVAGLTNASKSLWIASLFEKRSKPMVVVTHNLYQAQKLYEDLEELLDQSSVYLYPVNDLIASEIAAQSPELRSGRLEVLNFLACGGRGIIIAPIAGMKRLLPPKELWKKSLMPFQLGDVINIDHILEQLNALGYERVTMVSAPGEYSVRGGIIDIFSLTDQNPVRIELFDDEVDSIRYFDSHTQRSLDQLKSIEIGPAKEMLLYSDQYQHAAEALEGQLAKTLKKVKSKEVKEQLTEKIGYEIEQLKEEQFFQGVGKYTCFCYDQPATLLDYVDSNTLLVMDEISRIQEMAERLDREEAEWKTALIEKGEATTDVTLSIEWDDFLSASRHPMLYLSLFLRNNPNIHPQNVMNMSSRSMQSFHGQMNVLNNECQRWQKSGYAVVFLASDSQRAERMANILEDYDIKAQLVDKQSYPERGTRQIIPMPLAAGFELPEQKLAVITESEVFANKGKKTRTPRKQKVSNAERLKDYNELKVGDYVVHIDHGIGKYIGIETLEVHGVHKDYLQIHYKGNDKLYVPVENIDQVQKYVGSEGKEPKLYTLGGSEWKKVKNRAKSSVQDIADDLINLYAQREASRGHAFEQDSSEQQAFEQAFPYPETEDQLRAVTEIKADMESVRPMDRLLCGDVGYGKTEVALRAVFKAIAEGKQVAFLVPTTILAQQHFETTRERFSDFPVNIGMLSRFRSRKEQNETIKGLEKGTVDMVIGTHRLLSKDIKFKDLGLLIVDEEQRFGVTHKEKIKQLKSNVDVLTLTATPIPRTLHMSMLGVRDLSVIETPPENRFPVQTYVTEHNGALIREAVERELGRGGQIYFLYNKVESIVQMAEHISTLVPDARVAFAHGQMKETELEAVMLDFLEGAYDVLVSTTIIETGVDIPNVNTLIVHDADRMGLSQLYQLRGRVGRSNRVAYAYFTYQRDKIMNEVAEKRLEAIKEFTELGSGFKIAMRDLSIRGAGNLLGAEQHGFIDSVGFDLYSKMLKDAIEERKAGSAESSDEQPGIVSGDNNVTIEIDADAYIPEAYISDSLQKIEMYKRFKSVETMKDIQDLEDEMIDRFGDYPREVIDLFKISRMRVYANDLYIESIKRVKDQFIVIFSEAGSEQIDRVALFQTVSDLGRHIGLGADNQKIKLTVKTNAREHTSQQIEQLANVFEKIYKSQRKAA
ncbi:transcription-repair coupling factor [Tuberibacillus sp. Marseille-P3662]|uniref:transcription-repair coupling factor n=1 Tax=Tuberibacillus sp. Marseille-P3662 TaxID=1965358 RepID=UPI000A1CC6BA|nr:transcription-repair coupling factor [Tuberibacillus sp. Marseille-P3662]